MGGYGSGAKSTRKLTVEECMYVEISLFVGSCTVHPGGIMLWKNRDGETTSSIGFNSDFRGDRSASMRLSYSLGRDEERRRIEEPVQLTSTLPFFGGVRWWFTCPLIVNGNVCQRRVRKLYLPPGCVYFGCRTCYNLTYESVRTHDNRVNRLCRNPYGLMEAIANPDSSASLIALKAAFKLFDL
jgi:hypothetical protein